MFDGHHAMWGMHWGWWLFSLLCLGVFMYLAVLLLRRKDTEPRPSGRQPHEESKDILERRYAAGEISTEEYRERKTALDGRHG
jgi:putative membrane protein